MLLKKSRFYKINGKLREHIGNFKDYAICLKEECISKEINKNEINLFPVLIKLNKIKYLKKVNGNIIRKIKPKTLNLIQKKLLIEKINQDHQKDLLF